jgi:hypothetical protein
VQSKRADVRIINDEILSDNWYLLKNIPLTINDAMANGSDKHVKSMTGGMARLFCSTTVIKKR